MRAWRESLLRFLSAEDGPTAVEYAVMLALIIVVCIGAITTVGKNSSSVYSNVALNAAVSGSSSS
jgi:pilus assembly protein Flp/PilA